MSWLFASGCAYCPMLSGCGIYLLFLICPQTHLFSPIAPSSFWELIPPLTSNWWFPWKLVCSQITPPRPLPSGSQTRGGCQVQIRAMGIPP